MIPRVPHFSEWVTKADLNATIFPLATKADVTAAQAAILAAIAALTKKVTTMSSTLEGQLQTLTTELSADFADMSGKLDTVLSGVTPGATLSQADVDALTAVKAAADAMKAKLDAAVPPAAPAGP
jgi:pyridoxal/pyridoxine/pyridoxamine kinase